MCIWRFVNAVCQNSENTKGDYENDKNSRNAIRLWNTNKNIDFDVIDKTPNEIDTYDISRIKAGLTLKINQADILLVISGNYINAPHKDKDKIVINLFMKLSL